MPDSRIAHLAADAGAPVPLLLAAIELYESYGRLLDTGALDEWIDLFTEAAVYKAQPRENFDRGLPLATIYCSGKGMIRDRIFAIRETLVFSPRYVRHVTGLPRCRKGEGGISGEAAFAVFQTQPERPTQILATGRYIDRLVMTGNGLRIEQRLAVFDTLLLPNSLVYPL